MNKPQLARILLEEVNREKDNRRIATIIKEELLVLKLNQDILKEHQKLISERKDFWSVVLEGYLKAEHGEDFDSSLIEEGVWTNIKYYMGKMGSLEKGGKIFGKRKERVADALQKVQDAIEGATKKGFGDFKNAIEAEHKEFPNMREKVDFMAALYEIGGVYDSAEAAVASGNFPGGAGAANHLVHALREYVKWLLDFQLADAYKHFTEEKEIPEDVLEEQLQEWRAKKLNEAPPPVGGVASVDTPSAGRSPRRLGGTTAGGGGAPAEGPTGASYTKAGRQGAEVDSATIKGLKSNTAPLILAALGALGAGFGWLVQQPWFIAMFRDPGQWVTIKNVIMGTERVGVTEQLAVLQGTPGANLSGMGVGDFVKEMAKKGLTDGAGNPTKNLLDMASSGGNTGFANWWATNIANAVASNPAATLEEVIPLSGAGAVGAGGDIFTPKIAKIVVKTVFRQGATSVGAYQLAAAGPWITTLGIGLVSAGAAVKLLRMKGLKSSRAQMLGDLYKELVDFPEETKTDTIIGPTNGKEEPKGPCAEDEIEDPENPGKCIPKPTPVVVPPCKDQPGTAFNPDTGECDPVEEIPVDKLSIISLVRLDDDGLKFYKSRTTKNTKTRAAQMDMFQKAQDNAITGRNTDPSPETLRGAMKGMKAGPTGPRGEVETMTLKQLAAMVKGRADKERPLEAFLTVDASVYGNTARALKQTGHLSPKTRNNRPPADIKKAIKTSIMKALRLIIGVSKKHESANLKKITVSQAENILMRAFSTAKSLTKKLEMGEGGGLDALVGVLSDFGLVRGAAEVPAAKEKPMAPMVDTVKDMEGDRPGSMKESKTLDRWKTIAGIK